MSLQQESVGKVICCLYIGKRNIAIIPDQNLIGNMHVPELTSTGEPTTRLDNPIRASLKVNCRVPRQDLLHRKSSVVTIV